MSDIHKYKILIVLSILTFIGSACGSSSQSQENISTAVAQTVQAQNSLTKIANIPTLTPVPNLEITATVNPAVTNTSAPIVGAPGCTVSARLAGETPPDGTLLKPGEYFWKNWVQPFNTQLGSRRASRRCPRTNGHRFSQCAPGRTRWRRVHVC